jgi:cell division septal protein FtsQ
MAARDSLVQFEQAFVEETFADRDRRRAVHRQVAVRADERRRNKTHRAGSLRFGLLLLILLATAVGVTVAMFETLYYVMR